MANLFKKTNSCKNIWIPKFMSVLNDMSAIKLVGIYPVPNSWGTNWLVTGMQERNKLSEKWHCVYHLIFIFAYLSWFNTLYGIQSIKLLMICKIYWSILYICFIKNQWHEVFFPQFWSVCIKLTFFGGFCAYQKLETKSDTYFWSSGKYSSSRRDGSKKAFSAMKWELE